MPIEALFIKSPQKPSWSYIRPPKTRSPFLTVSGLLQVDARLEMVPLLCLDAPLALLFYMPVFDIVFWALGLPWKRVLFRNGKVTIRRSVADKRLAKGLPSSYSQKTTWLANVDKSSAWYSRSQKSNEAAAAFTKVGFGRVGHIGDVT